MLRLVINNTKETANNDVITCRNSCDLFDSITESCSINEKVNVDSAYEAARCGFFMSKESMAPSSDNNSKRHVNFKFSLIEENEDYLLDDPEMFHELIGKKVHKETYTYPNEPDFSSFREDAKWYISPCGTYGCWIINLSKRPSRIPTEREEAEQGWTDRVYKSPVPLHDHTTNIPLASKVVWLVDEEGYGQYALLVNGQIASISSPKPKNWRK